MKPSKSIQRSPLASTLWTFRREFAVCLVFTIVVNVLMLTPTLYMLQVFDRVMVSYNTATLMALTLVMLFFFAVLAFSEWVRSRLLVRLGVRFDDIMSSRVFAAGFQASLSQGRHNPTQTFADLTNLRQFMTGSGLFAFLDAPWTPIYLLVLFMLHPSLGWLGVVFAFILMALAFLSHRLTHEPVEAAMEAGTQVATFLYAKLRNAEAIEAMGMRGNLRQRWLRQHLNYLALNGHAVDVGARMQSLIKWVRYTLQSLSLGAGALLVIQGELTAGAMIAANVLIGRVTQPLDQIVANWKGFLGARKAFRNLDTLLAEFPPRQDARPHAAPVGRVRLQNLVARAPGRSEPILKDITADFEPGEVIGIVGPSGSGKSTLARAFVGIWPNREGAVLLDGEPIESWDRQQLGPHIGYLPQDIELFDGTIAENVSRFGELDPDEVIRACERAGVHDMILRFPKGYDTPVGEAGNLLSGGQRQRIGLARALYGDPRVIVLDEPNANLDDLGEAALAQAVRDLKERGSTVFLITHRKAVVALADRLLLLDNGRVAHFGTLRQVASGLTVQPT